MEHERNPLATLRPSRFAKPHLDLIEIAQRIPNIQRSILPLSTLTLALSLSLPLCSCLLLTCTTLTRKRRGHSSLRLCL